MYELQAVAWLTHTKRHHREHALVEHLYNILWALQLMQQPGTAEADGSHDSLATADESGQVGTAVLTYTNMLVAAMQVQQLS